MNQGPVILHPRGGLAVLRVGAQNYYEAMWDSPKRTFIYSPIQNARKDLNRYTREQLMRKARYLWKNSPFIRGLIERIVTLTVGAGFHPVFTSSSPEWNLLAKKVWDRKARSVNLGARCSFSQYQRCVARARFLDGECFSLKTSDDEVTMEDLLQGLEAEMIRGDSGTKALADEKQNGCVDGFNLNAQGVVLSYNVRGVDQPYEAQHIVHHFTPNRLGQYRGETVLAAAINTAHDVDDILVLEKACVKDASGRKDIIKTASGQLDAESFRRARWGETESGIQTFGLPQGEEDKGDYYKMRFGEESVVLKRGDEYTPYVPDRPGNAWQGFMAFLANTICVSTDFPPSVVLPISIGGTDIRRDLDITQRVVEPLQMDMIQEFDEAIDYLMAGEIQDGVLRKGLPDDYQNRTWYMPQKVNVDRGQIEHDINQVKAGLMSREEFHGRWGDSAVVVDQTIVQEAIRRRDAIQAAGFKTVEEFVQVTSLDPSLFGTQPQTGKDKQNGTP